MAKAEVKTEEELLAAQEQREAIESRIRCLVSKLDAPTSDVGDWKVTKIYEARLKGEPDPYNFEELAAARQAVRDEINALQTELAEL